MSWETWTAGTVLSRKHEKTSVVNRYLDCKLFHYPWLCLFVVVLFNMMIEIKWTIHPNENSELVVQRWTLSLHSMKVPGVGVRGRGLSLQSKDMQVGLPGDFTLPVGMNVGVLVCVYMPGLVWDYCLLPDDRSYVYCMCIYTHTYTHTFNSILFI